MLRESYQLFHFLAKNCQDVDRPVSSIHNTTKDKKIDELTNLAKVELPINKDENLSLGDLLSKCTSYDTKRIM